MTIEWKEAWEDSGKVYGYRKPHEDLKDQGESRCPNLVAGQTRTAGIKAQIGYKRRAGIYCGKPTIAVDNTLFYYIDGPGSRSNAAVGSELFDLLTSI